MITSLNGLQSLSFPRDQRETGEKDQRERDQQDTRDGSMADGLDELEVARNSQRQLEIARDS